MEEIRHLKQTIKKLDGQNKSSLQSIEQLNRQVAQLKESERHLLEDNDILSEELAEHRDLSLCKDVEHSKEQKKLKIALNNMETKIMECAQAEKRERKWIRENKALNERVADQQKIIYSRQKTWEKEEADLIEKYENKIKEVRSDLDEKLYRMKEKMKMLFTEAATKTKEKHDQELLELKNENLMLSESHNNPLTKEMYKMNQQILQLQKENEFLKNRLRLLDSNRRESRLSAPIFSSTLKMEDEVGEVFNHMHLGNAKSSIPTSSTSRETTRLIEMQQRNALVPHHLRSSTYAGQQVIPSFMRQNIKTSSSKRRTT